VIIIADASPVHYLVLVQAEYVLPKLFKRVLIPAEVQAELRDPGAPAMVREWVAAPPRWLEIQPATTITDAGLAALDDGEAAAIQLAENLRPNAFLLMDDAKGRKEAARRRIPSTGTLGVLQAGSKQGYLRLSDVLPRLLRTNFYVAEQLVESLLAEERSRRTEI
jgi:predicted nucleic acid-binding protein